MAERTRDRLRRRRRTPRPIVSSIAAELERARDADDPWPLLERAHILSQPWAWQHTRVHAAMLRLALAQRDRAEVVGQLVRLVVAGPGSIAGRFPLGNTGRTTMALTETADVPPDLAEQLSAAGRPSN